MSETLDRLLLNQLRFLLRREQHDAIVLSGLRDETNDSLNEVIGVMHQSSNVISQMLRDAIAILDPVAAAAEIAEGESPVVSPAQPVADTTEEVLHIARGIAKRQILEFEGARNIAQLAGEVQILGMFEAIQHASESLVNTLDAIRFTEGYELLIADKAEERSPVICGAV